MHPFIPVTMMIALFFVPRRRHKRFFMVKCAISMFLLVRLSELTSEAKDINLAKNVRPQKQVMNDVNGTATVVEHRYIPEECRELQLHFLSLQRHLAFYHNLDVLLDPKRSMDHRIAAAWIAVFCILTFRETTVNFGTRMLMSVNLLSLIMNCLMAFTIGVFDSRPGDTRSVFPIGIAQFLFLFGTCYEFLAMLKQFPVEGACATYSSSWLYY
jgi:hypothetical protein